MKKFVYILSIIGYTSFLLWGGYRYYKNIHFGFQCERFLNRSADASTIEDASIYLATAIDYCENHDLMSGSTSIIYPTDDDNIGIWYRRLKTSFTFLNSVPSNALPKEKIIALKKLRTVLVITDDTGRTKLICPEGISIYPYNREYLVWVIISSILILVSEYILSGYKEDEEK